MPIPPYVMIVGEEHLTRPLQNALAERGVESLCVADGATAAELVDEAEKQGYPIDIAFISSQLHQAQLEWLLAYIRAKDAFVTARIIVLGAENERKIKYWLELGATSCVGTSPEEVEVTASYWATLFVPTDPQIKSA